MGHTITTLVGLIPSGSSPVNAAQPFACSSLAQRHSPQINSTSPGIPTRIFEGSQLRRKRPERTCPEHQLLSRNSTTGYRSRGRDVESVLQAPHTFLKLRTESVATALGAGPDLAARRGRRRAVSAAPCDNQGMRDSATHSWKHLSSCLRPSGPGALSLRSEGVGLRGGGRDEAGPATKTRAQRRGHLPGSRQFLGRHVSARWRPGVAVVKAREEAELFLADRVREIRRGQGRVPKVVTFREAANAWLDYCQHDRACAASTIRDRRSVLDRWLIPAFGERKLHDVTGERISRWRREQMRGLVEKPDGTTRPLLGRRNAEKVVSLLYSIFEWSGREYGLPSNPVAHVERLPVKYDGGRIEAFYSPEEVWTLRRHATSDQDGVVFLTAAFAGLRRGECLALRWRDVDFQNRTIRVEQSITVDRQVKSTKSGKAWAVPMCDSLAGELDRLSRRGRFTGPDDLVFLGETGGPLDGSALRRRYMAAQKRAKLKPIRFHDLRHSFGSNAINVGNPREVQEWMGHADYRTTARYLHYRDMGDAANRLGKAFGMAPEVELELQPDCNRTPSTEALSAAA